MHSCVGSSRPDRVLHVLIRALCIDMSNRPATRRLQQGIPHASCTLIACRRVLQAAGSQETCWQVRYMITAVKVKQPQQILPRRGIDPAQALQS